MFAHYIFVYALVYTDFPVYTQRLTRGHKSVCYVEPAEPVLDTSSHDSSVSTMPTLRAGRSEFESWHREVLFYSPKRLDGLRTPPSLLFSGYWVPILATKRPGHDADPSPPTAKIRNEWSYTSAPPI